MREEGSTEQKYYSVSEAVQKCGVPSHVLRYWEEELALPIQRTAQGHRVYSEENLVTFRRVKELKGKGIQLKAIRMMLDETEDGRVLERFFEQEAAEVQEAAESQRAAEVQEAVESQRAAEVQEAAESREAGDWDSEEADYEIIPSSEATNYQRFESMLRALVSEAVAEQNEKLEQALAELIRDEIEDLYLQLCQDEGRREAAASTGQSRMSWDAGDEELQDADTGGRIRQIRGIIRKLSKGIFRA